MAGNWPPSGRQLRMNGIQHVLRPVVHTTLSPEALCLVSSAGWSTRSASSRFLSGGRKHRSVTFDVRLYRRFEISPLHPTPHVPESQFPKPCQECNQPSKLALPPVSPMCLMCPCERLSLTIRLTLDVLQVPRRRPSNLE